MLIHGLIEQVRGVLWKLFANIAHPQDKSVRVPDFGDVEIVKSERTDSLRALLPRLLREGAQDIEGITDLQSSTDDTESIDEFTIQGLNVAVITCSKLDPLSMSKTHYSTRKSVRPNDIARK